MAWDLSVKTFTNEPEQFIAGADFPIMTAVKTASVAVKAHAPVGLGADGKLALITNGGSSVDTSTLYGIAAEDAAAEAECVVYLTGEFFGDKLALESDVTVDKLEVPMRKLGIFLK